MLTSHLQRLPLLPSGRAQGVSHRVEVEGDGVMLRALGVPVGQLQKLMDRLRDQVCEGVSRLGIL